MLDQETLERSQARVIPKNRLEEFLRGRRRQRIESQLPIVRLAAPAVLVLRTVIDEQQHPRRRQALHEPIQHRLRLAVDPVKVLEDHDERLHLALARRQALHRAVP